jgi:hypothetical protein
MVRPNILKMVIRALLILLSTGCAVQEVRQFDRFKPLASKGDHAAIVKETVDCTAADPGCDQLHLIRGMACYHEAKAGVNPKPRYQCAIDELKRGIELAQQDGEPAADNEPYLRRFWNRYVSGRSSQKVGRRSRRTPSCSTRKHPSSAAFFRASPKAITTVPLRYSPQPTGVWCRIIHQQLHASFWRQPMSCSRPATISQENSLSISSRQRVRSNGPSSRSAQRDRPNLQP